MKYHVALDIDGGIKNAKDLYQNGCLGHIVDEEAEKGAVV